MNQSQHALRWTSERLLMVACLSSAILGDGQLHAQEFQIEAVAIHDSVFNIHFPAEDAFYYILYRSNSPFNIDEPVGLELGFHRNLQTGSGVLSDWILESSSAFYRIEKVSVLEARDMDADTYQDVWELSAGTNPLDPNDVPSPFHVTSLVSVVTPALPGSATDSITGLYSGSVSASLVVPALPTEGERTGSFTGLYVGSTSVSLIVPTLPTVGDEFVPGVWLGQPSVELKWP